MREKLKEIGARLAIAVACTVLITIYMVMALVVVPFAALFGKIGIRKEREG